MSRSFHLGTILSVTTGRLVAPGHIADVHEFLEYMAGEPIWTHQLPRVMDEAKPALLAQHPQLAEVAVPDDFGNAPEKGVASWVAEQIERLATTMLEIRPLDDADHTSIDPISELCLRGTPTDRIIPVVVDLDGPP